MSVVIYNYKKNLTHFLKKCEVTDENFCQTHVTSPFVSTQLIKSAGAKLNEGYDVVYGKRVKRETTLLLQLLYGRKN